MGRTDKSRVPALAYLRTSSAANVGDGKASDKRQRDAIQSFAKHAGYELVGEFYDAAVSGADPIDTRPGFRDLLEQIVGVFSQLEKTRLVKKLKAARDRKRRAGARVEGRKTRIERLQKANTREA